jgi:acetoin utilization deacetylase AcuC-like enzyme
MILQVRERNIAYMDYGIMIPSSPSKSDRIIEFLRSRPCFKARSKEKENDWLKQWDGVEITKDDLLRVHSQRYVDQLFSEGPDGLQAAIIDAYELRNQDGSYNRYRPEKAVRPLTEILHRTLINVAGTYQCCRLALESGFCFYLGGGTHHAHRDFGHGFCPVNDAVIAIRRLQAAGKIRSAWIIDVDVHKGDGTAALTQGDDSVVTVSVHMANGWPLDLPERDADGNQHPSHIASDFDVPIASGEERFYVPRLIKALESLAQKPEPDIAIVLSGVDPYEHDTLPSTQLMQLTLDQLYERDTVIFDFLTNLGIPRAYLMAGGYGERAWEPYPPFLEYVCEALHP